MTRFIIHNHLPARDIGRAVSPEEEARNRAESYRSHGISQDGTPELEALRERRNSHGGGQLDTRDDIAYRGYLIRVNPFRNEIHIEKDGHHIGYAKTLADAKRIIDELLD